MAGLHASAAPQNSRPGEQAATGFAPLHARPSSGVWTEQIESTQPVAFAVLNSKPTDSSPPQHAQEDAAGNFGLQRQQGATTLQVLRVQSAGRSDVYCMEVPGFNAFAIANGAVVHNCATRYGLMMLRHATVNRVEPVRIAQPYRVSDRSTGVLG